MLKELIKAKEWIIDVLMPRKCLGCGREGLYICKDCAIFLSEVELNMKEVKPLSLMSVWEYEGLMEKLILKIKYGGCYDIIDELVEKAFEKIELNLPKDTHITYVPMYLKKEKRRGFNPAELIARKVGERTNRPVTGLLKKIKDNRSQMDLSPKERRENVRGSFCFNPAFGQYSSPSKVILVDDVYATGATMNECAKVLRENGIKEIWGFTLARDLNL